MEQRTQQQRLKFEEEKQLLNLEWQNKLNEEKHNLLVELQRKEEALLVKLRESETKVEQQTLAFHHSEDKLKGVQKELSQTREACESLSKELKEKHGRLEEKEVTNISNNPLL